VSTNFVHCTLVMGDDTVELWCSTKVGESLYPYSSNGVYYARIKPDGKEIKRSLGRSKS